MKVIVCYKVVPEELKIEVNPDRSLSFKNAEWKLSQYDLNAVEAAMQLVEAVGGKVSALSVGDEKVDNSKLKKSILARGPEDLYLVKDNQLQGADANQTAAALAAAVTKIGFDLVLCGEGSADLYAQQVGIQLGEMLKVPVINAVSRITPEGGKLVVERTLEDETEVLEVSLPAVLSVTADINVTRLPGMKEILAAGKKPMIEWDLHKIGIEHDRPKVLEISTLAPEQTDRKKIRIEGDSERQIAELIEYIRKELK
jgi:Electron transfer flavoprotein, beta subunit